MMKDSIKESNFSKSDSIDESNNKKNSQLGPNFVKYQRLSTENTFNKKSTQVKCNKRKKILIISLIMFLFIIIALILFIFINLKSNNYSSNKANYYQETNLNLAKDMMYTNNIGFSTGGAKDINNFRENIKNGYFPIATDITYNGLFYDYYFDTGKKTESEYLFSPSYSCSISKDPISFKNEYYITVGLNSNIKQSDFQRKKINLIVLLDISGSMISTFDSYYYDQLSLDKKNISKSDDDKKSKMEIANESVNILIDQLKADDRLGIVLFNHETKK